MIHKKKGRATNFHGKSWIGRRHCGLGLAKGWSAEKLEVLVTRYASKLLKAKLTTLARNVNDVA